MLDEIADSMEQSLFEQQLPQWCAATAVVALITWMTAPPVTPPLPRSLPGLIASVLVSEEVGRTVGNERTD